MALLGSSVDPRLFVQDYSGFTRAADIQSQSMQNLGQQVAGGIERYGEQKQQRKKLDAGIKATVTGIESAIKMGDSLGIDVKSSLTPYLEKINDPNVSPIEAAAYAQQASNSISNVLNFGMKANEIGLEKERYKQASAARIAELQAEARKPGAIVEVNTPEGTRQMVRNSQTGELEPLKVAGVSQGTGLVDLVKGFEGFNPNAYGDYKQTSVGYGTKGEEGEVLTEAQATDRLNTELSGHAKRIEDAAKLKGVKLNQNQFNALTSFDFNTGRGADLIERFGDKPEELVSKMQEYTKAGGEELPGLVKRRGIEAALFLTPTEDSIGFKPKETEKQETPMTAEQVQNLAVQGFKVNARPLADGSFMVSGADIGGQTGETIETTPEGGFRIVRGGGGGGKMAATKEAQKEQSFERSRAIIGSASKIIPQIQSVLSENPLIAVGQKAIGDVLPATEVGRIAADLETVRVVTSKEEVNNARAASPTGSAGGSITEKEWPKFENRFGKMEVGMNPNDLVSNVQKTALNQFESVNGTPEDVIKLFSDGKISKPVFDEYLKEYKQTRSILGISDNGTGGPGDDWTKYNQNLLRFDKEKQNQLSPEAQSLQDRLDALKLKP
jgi:GH24 family phage-related lysozyme (muramidase)